MTDAEQLDWWRDQSHRRMDECQRLTTECERLRAELAEQKAVAEIQAALNGTLRAEIRRQMDELAEQKRVNLKLAERLAACSEVLGRAAGRVKVCQCSVTPSSAAP